MQEGIANIHLSVEEYASLRGCTVQYVRKLCSDKKLDAEIPDTRRRGGRSGITYRIPLASLPDKEIKRYLKNRKKQELLERPVEHEEKVIHLDYEHLTADEREELNLKNKILDDWITFRNEYKENGRPLADADENYVRVIQLQYPKLSMSLRTIRRWDETRRKQGEVALVDRRGKHGNHQTLMKQEVFDLFEYYYLDESRLSVTMCITLAKAELRKKGMNDIIKGLPSERTFQRWIEKIPLPVLQFYRYGEKACKDKCLPYIHRSYEDLYSNDIWVCDNHTFDIIVTDGEKPLRVYLTGFLDVRSRKMVGWYVTMNPSSDATLYALRRGIENYGIPNRILSDNGREFLTFDIGGRGFRKAANKEVDPETILERLGIDFKTAMVRNARAKIIERTFETVKNEFSKLFEHYTGGNILERPERMKKLGKDIDHMMVLEDFAGFVDTWITGYYNMRASQGIGMHGMTPDQAYSKYLVEQRRASAGELNLMLLRSARLQTVRRDGVKLKFYDRDIYFLSDELIMNHQGEKVFIRYNPDNLESVRVYDEQERYILTAQQDKTLSYFASKQEVAEKMREQRSLERVVKSYKKDKNIKATEALELIMSAAEQNIRDGREELNPDIIRIVRAPDFMENMETIQKAVGGDVVDWSIANRRIKEARGEE